MKIAVFSDIHGNIAAFDAAIYHARKHMADIFIVAGDLITDYPLASAIISRAMALTTNIVKGNREDYIIKRYIYEGSQWDSCVKSTALSWTLGQLSSEEMIYINNLPERLSIKLDDKNSILVVHGSPASMYDVLNPVFDIETVAKSIKKINETIIVCGHTHMPWLGVIGNKYYINPGSIGACHEKGFKAQYALLTYDGGHISAEIFDVGYSSEVLVQALYDNGIMDNINAEYWVRLLIKSQADGINYLKNIISSSEYFTKMKGIKHYDLPTYAWKEALSLLKKQGVL